jgi:hypothetical protein
MLLASCFVQFQRHLSGAPIQGRLLASPPNIILGCKGFPGTNALAYYENPYITTVKSFIVQAPGVRVIKFIFFITNAPDKSA